MYQVNVPHRVLVAILKISRVRKAMDFSAVWLVEILSKDMAPYYDFSRQTGFYLKNNARITQSMVSDKRGWTILNI